MEEYTVKGNVPIDENARNDATDEKNNKPWHIRIDFTEPHLPCQPVEEFAQMYIKEDIPEWGSFQE